MNYRNNPFQVLADRARCGDATAKAQLREELEPQLVCIVRSTLQRHRERTPLDRQIWATARRLQRENPRVSPGHPEEFILRVARSVCSQVVANIRPRQESGFLSAETVADFADPAVRMTA